MYKSESLKNNQEILTTSTPHASVSITLFPFNNPLISLSLSVFPDNSVLSSHKSKQKFPFT